MRTIASRWLLGKADKQYVVRELEDVKVESTDLYPTEGESGNEFYESNTFSKETLGKHIRMSYFWETGAPVVDFC